MPSRPPQTQFYKDSANHELWRDITRLYEDWIPSEEENRNIHFSKVLQDVINNLRASQIEEVLEENAAASSNG